MRTHHQHPGDDGINAHIPANTRIEQERMVCAFFFPFIAVVVVIVVLGSKNAHPTTEAYINRTLLVSRVIYKLFCRCVVRFKFNHGPSACRTVWRTRRFRFLHTHTQRQRQREKPPKINERWNFLLRCYHFWLSTNTDLQTRKCVTGVLFTGPLRLKAKPGWQWMSWGLPT